MCGIAGLAGFSDKKLLGRMLQSLKHRGPDDEAFLEYGGVSLGYRRLAVIDLATGDQPFFSEDKNLALFYNGEIYNFKDLRSRLEKLNHQFKTQSDGEVIVHGFEEWGRGVFEKLNGMFAVALFNVPKRRLFLVRDHFGIKPLYYHFDKNRQRLIFASEIKALLCCPALKRIPNGKIIYQYLTERVHDHSEETFFEGVKKLLPGELMEVSFNGSGLQLNRKIYWSLPLRSSDSCLPRTTELIEQFGELLKDSVRLRLVSDVPLGVCLSGGLDSSTISLLIDRLTAGPQKTFSAVFPGQVNDELEYIKTVNQKTSAKPYFVYPKSENLFSELEDVVRVQEEPFISSGPYAQYCVMREASKRVKVLLDGQGGDELLAGYDPYHFVYLRQFLREGRLLDFFAEALAVRGLLFKYLRPQAKRLQPTALLKKDFYRTYKSYRTYKNTDNLKRRLYEDVFKYSLPALLRYEDKNSSAFSLESRVPFLDPRLVEFIFSLPEDLIINRGVNKYILRQSQKDLLPQKIYNRQWKVGFTTPEEAWFRRQGERILDIFRSKSFKRRDYWKAQEVSNAFYRFLSADEGDSMLFWRFLNLEIWLRIFID